MIDARSMKPDEVPSAQMPPVAGVRFVEDGHLAGSVFDSGAALAATEN
jgi:hypothetical protein